MVTFKSQMSCKTQTHGFFPILLLDERKRYKRIILMGFHCMRCQRYQERVILLSKKQEAAQTPEALHTSYSSSCPPHTYLETITLTGNDIPPPLPGREEALTGVTLHPRLPIPVTLDTAAPSLPLRQVNHLIILWIQNGFLLTTRLEMQNHI